MKTQLVFPLAALGVLLGHVSPGFAQGTAFTYQGRLMENGVPANGSNDFTFTLYTAATGGAIVGASNIVSDLAVSNGLFTATLDYGPSAFDGSVRWLQTAVRPGTSVGAYANLAPRQHITAAPYAITAGNLNGALSSASLSGTYANALTLNNPANSFSGNGAGLTNLNASRLVSGTILDARLSPNVALRAGGNTFTGDQTVAGNLGYSGQLTKLDVAEQSAAYVRSYDLWLGHSSRHGSQGRALVDLGNSLALNYDRDWPGLNLFGQVVLDPFGQNTNGLLSGGLLFGGGSSGEGILSKRGPGGNQYGLDFYTFFQPRLSIANNGNVGIGTIAPATALQVNGTVTADRFVAIAAAGVEPPSGVTPILSMIWIKPATFILGSPSSEPERTFEEGPQTVVTITKGFWMAHHEVTQGEYQTVIGSNPSTFTGDLNRPVETVSWNDATNYCRLLTQSERTAGRLTAGWGYRLPTEPEWEYACRAWTTTRFGYGDDLSGTILTNYAWHSVNSGNVTHPVGQKLANSWGLVDMHGNVWEWCQDWYDTYPGGSVADPTGPVTGSGRVFRGGSWYDAAFYCRSAIRLRINPDFRNSSIGFRVVLAPGQP